MIVPQRRGLDIYNEMPGLNIGASQRAQGPPGNQPRDIAQVLASLCKSRVLSRNWFGMWCAVYPRAGAQGPALR